MASNRVFTRAEALDILKKHKQHLDKNEWIPDKDLVAWANRVLDKHETKRQERIQIKQEIKTEKRKSKKRKKK